MIIYLIGYRCTGKTAVSENLAKKTGWPVLDSDVELVNEQGRTIADIVDADGWDTFRKMESDVIKRLSRLDHHIIATGGGVILKEDNILNMKTTGKVIWLKATPETIQKRMVEDLKTGDNRPSLTDKGLYAEIADVLNTRTPLYEKAMDISIDTDHMDIENISDQIIATLDIRRDQ